MQAWLSIGYRFSWAMAAAIVLSSTSLWSQADTWIRGTGVEPGPLDAQAMAYDAARLQVIVHEADRWMQGSSKTWAWRGKGWVRLQPNASPPDVDGDALCFYPPKKLVYLFGGEDWQGPIAETWLWNGLNWIQVHPKTSPPARSGHKMVYDAARGQIFLHGGQQGNKPLNDSWVWNGSDWALVKPQSSLRPPAFDDFTLAYDSTRKEIVLFESGQTWTWNGKVWTRRQALPPSTGSGARMAYHPPSKTVIRFGGQNGAQFLAETWAWDGTTWKQLKPLRSPYGRARAGMVWDASRNQIFLHGGSGIDWVTDTWGYDGKTWKLKQPDFKPRVDAGHAVAYDAARTEVLLVDPSISKDRPDTWVWNGQHWKSKASLGQVIGMWNYSVRHSMAYDAKRREVVVLAYAAGKTVTALWNGNKWRKASPKTSPPMRFGTAMAYDERNQQVVLFGGRAGSRKLLGDTWTWDGKDWTLHKTQGAPSPREGHAMAYDPVSRRVLLFGGDTSAETWAWDGRRWSPLFLLKTWPTGRSYHAMATDPIGKRILLYGGLVWSSSTRNLEPIGDTWTWTATGWTKLKLHDSPPALWQQAMAFDTARRRMVLTGGQRSNGPSDETWLFGPPAFQSRFDLFGAGCGVLPQLALRASTGSLPRSGGKFVMSTTHAPTATKVGVFALGVSQLRISGFYLPLPLDSIGMPGCHLYQSMEITQMFALSAGSGSLTLPVPSQPGLIGRRMFAQVFVPAPLANRAGVLASNGGAITIGTW